MSTPPASEVNATANADKTALQNAANNTFISYADMAIADSASQGKFLVRLTLFAQVDLQYIVTYYQGLGYQVGVPYPPNLGSSFSIQPAQLFGPFWINFWEGNDSFFLSILVQRPFEIFISWPTPP